jgi:hypothetical protein
VHATVASRELEIKHESCRAEKSYKTAYQANNFRKTELVVNITVYYTGNIDNAENE